MEPSTLRSVPESADTGSKRAAARKRPSEPLPTDRMKLDVQWRALRALARLSNDRKPISNVSLAAAIDNEVSHYSVGLSHRFFVECGWLQRVGRGDYAATDALVDYGRRLGADPQHPENANVVLRTAVRTGEGWFWPIIYRQVENGPAPISEVRVSLMTAAQVGQDHTPQVKMLFDWLQSVGLIVVTDDTVALADASTTPIATVEQDKPREDATPDTTGAQVPKSTTQGQPPAGPTPGTQPPVLTFSFAFSLTAADLAELSPEQISETFAAVGKLMAIKK